MSSLQRKTSRSDLDSLKRIVISLAWRIRGRGNQPIGMTSQSGSEFVWQYRFRAIEELKGPDDCPLSYELFTIGLSDGILI
jgi:hypothetical protein